MPTFTPLTPDTFASFVAANRFAVIHFWASWNGHARTMKQRLASELPVELRDQFALGSFDTDPPSHHELCRQHKFQTLPFLEFYRDGALVGTLIGLRTAEVIADYIREVLQDPATPPTG